MSIRPVRKMTAPFIVTLEYLIDSGNATPEQIAEYNEREALRPKPSRRVRFTLWRWRLRDRWWDGALHNRLFGEHGDDW